MRLINFQHRQNKRMRKDKRGGIRQLLSILLIVSFCFSMMFTDMPDVEAAAVSESEMAETETAAEKGSAQTETAETAETAAQTEQKETAAAQQTMQETNNRQNEQTDSGEDEMAAEETESDMPARTLYAQTSEEKEEDRITVYVDAPEGALPVDAQMTVKTVTNSRQLKKAKKASKVKGGQDDSTDANTTRFVKEKAAEITFKDADGNEIEPLVPVRVSFFAADIANAAEDATVVHVGDNGKAKVVGQVADSDLDAEPSDDEVVFDADQFSVYAVVYTVDFHYGDHTYNMNGDSSVRLSELLDSLKIEKDEDGNILTADDVSDAQFSDDSLVSVSRENDEIVLKAKKAFDTDEQLILTLKNGDQITVDVTDDNTDFGQYLTKVTVEKQQNGSWVPMTYFNDGDTVRINLEYSLPAGVITSDKKTVTYQLPDGVKPEKAESGDITQNDKTVGKYTIDQNGLVTLTFNDDFAQDGKGLDGTVTFKGTVSNTSGQQQGTITFGGNGGSITVVTPVQDNYDIHTKKEGSLGKVDTANKQVTASYKITVSTKNGTGSTVDISDQYASNESTNVSSFSYKQDSLKVYKVDASGNKTQITSGYNLNWTTVSGQSDSDPKFDITNLPALGAGEKYEIDYDATVKIADLSQDTKFDNLAHSHSGNHDEWWRDSEEAHPSLEKTGQYDSATNTVGWTLKLNNGNGEDVSDWHVGDKVSTVKIDGYINVLRIKEDGSYERVAALSDFDGKTEFSFKMGELDGFKNLTDEQKKGNFVIQYRTTVPDNIKPGQNTNEHNNAWYWSEKGGNGKAAETVYFTLRDWDVAKSLSRRDADNVQKSIDGMVYEHWNANVTIGAGKLKSFTYTDEIEQVLDDNGTDQHYATAADLESYFTMENNANANRNTGLYLKLGEFDRYNYNGAGKKVTKSYYYGADKETNDVDITVTYYDADGNVVDPTDSTTHVKKFVVNVKPKGNINNAQALVLPEYRTMINTETQKEGQTWTIKNKGTTGNHSSEAQDSYTKPHKFDKQVYTGKTDENQAVYKDGDAKVPYKWGDENSQVRWPHNFNQTKKLEDGQIQYRLMLHTTQEDGGKDGVGGTITITDILPAGMTLVEDSVFAKFYENENDQGDENWATERGINSNFTSNSKPTCTTKANDDGTTTLTITIPDYHWGYVRPDVAVYYTVQLTDEAWKDLNTTECTYNNTAEWNGNKSSDNVTVHRDENVLEKNGVQLDKDGNPVKLENGQAKVSPTGTIRYSIVINPAAQDLVKNVDTLTLVDTMDSDASQFNPQLDVSSVHLYNYDSSKKDHIGKEVDTSAYMIHYDATTGKITMTIPDSKALVFVYDYNLDESFSSGKQITNHAELNGSWSTSKSVTLVETSSSATARKKKIVLYKVDSQNFHTTLPGTVFKLERYDGNAVWTTVDEKGNANTNARITVGQDGTITWDLSGQTPPLKADTLYRLTETQAVDGYALDQTHHYFIWRDQNSTVDQAYNNARAGDRADDNGTGAVQKENISIFSHSGGVMYIENTYTRVSVKKLWENSDGSSAGTPANTQVKVQLQRQTEKPDGYYVQVTSKISTGGGQHVWEKIYVQKNTPITIWIRNSESLSKDAEITYNSKTYTMKGQTINYNNYYVYTIPSVDSDLDVTINTPNWEYTELTFHDYTAAPKALSTDVENVGDPVTLSSAAAGKDLQYSWDNLLQQDASGNQYYYSVKEVSVTQDGKDVTGNYTVSYINNAGIKSGQVTITNQSSSKEYDLPSSGGTGPWRYIGTGFAILALAAFLYILKYRRLPWKGASKS